jgi:CRISP-associated protein Cas1
MNPLYVDLLVCNIGLSDHCLVIKDRKHNRILQSFKPREFPYDSIVLQKQHGAISFDAINWLIAHAVTVTILDWQGNIRAQILPSEPISNELKLAQYQAYLDRKVHMRIARTIVETKLQRQKQFLESLSESYPVDVPRIVRISATSEDFMRNSEARYAISYFEQFGKVCKELGHDFSGRGTKSNMHANDLVNSLLNYGYGVLQTYVQRAISAIGLDNSLPFVHDLGRSRGLVFDFMEFWRTNVDYSVLETLKRLDAINYRVYRLNDNFEAVLSSDTSKLLFERVRFNLSLQEIIMNCRVLAKFVLGESRALSFNLKPIDFKPVFETDRVKGLILSKSARELGMNKSSLWYQKKRLSERGTIRLYNSSKWHFHNAES